MFDSCYTGRSRKGTYGTLKTDRRTSILTNNSSL